MQPQTEMAQLDLNNQQLICSGEWNITHLTSLQQLIEQLPWPLKGNITVNGSAITHMDSAGAWLLNSLPKELSQKKIKLSYENFSQHYQALMLLVEKKAAEQDTIVPIKIPSWIAVLGKNTVDFLLELKYFFAFIGELTSEMLRLIYRPTRWRLSSLVDVIDKTGFQALPIIGLLSFMIGVVLAYQMGVQLKNYGANIYVVDLLGLSVLREFGPLLTAIIVAGRTGSAFTAQLGLMKTNQEIDALNTMGITPGELLLIPRILGLFIALPLLTIWADIFGILGGMFMANNMLDIGWNDFLTRFQSAVPLKTLMIGLGKAPIFALLIASIGCFQGMQVQGSAESLGKNTTRSVVLSIFMIILADAIFSIIFSKLKL